MHSERIAFDNAHGDRLSGRLDEPGDASPVGWAIFAHCFTCSKNLKAVRRVAEALVARGWGVMSFDFTGLGESEGDFGASGLSGDVADLRAAAAWLAEHRAAPRLMIGHSFGGSAVLAAADTLESVRAVVSIAAPADPWHVTHLFSDEIETIRSNGTADVTIEGRTFRVRDTLIEDLSSTPIEHRPVATDTPLLIFHAPADAVVPIENARRIYDASEHPKSFVSLAGADHLLRREADAVYVADVLAAWASRYAFAPRAVPTESETAGGEGASSDEASGVTAHIGAESYATTIRLPGHRFTADASASEGGAGGDRGPSPAELVMAGLASCTAITMSMYARRKSWPMREARVEVRRADPAQRTDDRRTALELRVEPIGDLDDEQRQRLLEIAERCPVHRMLEQGVSMTRRPDPEA